MSKGIVGKVLSKTYLFPKSRDAMELLRKLIKGEADDSGLTGGYDWHYYTTVFNICTEFGEQVLDTIALLGRFNNRVVDMQEEYMPSYPPMSPVTTSYFNAWMALDAPVTERSTLGLLYSRYIFKKKTMLYAQKAMDILNSSYVSFYQVVGGDWERTFLWDIVGKREIEARCTINDISASKYQPSIGDVWYARLLPSLREGDFPHVVFCTPYVFRTTGRKHWEEFFARRNARQGDGPDGIVNYLKRGDSFGYWLEFVFQTYMGHTGEAIFSEGLPDIQKSRPHGEQESERLS